MNIINKSLLNLDSINCEANLTLKTTLQHNNYHQNNDNTQTLSLNALTSYSKNESVFVSSKTIRNSIIAFLLMTIVTITYLNAFNLAKSSSLPSPHTTHEFKATESFKTSSANNQNMQSILLMKLTTDMKNISLRKAIASLYIEQQLFFAATSILEAGAKYANEGEYFALMAFAQQNANLNTKSILSYKRALGYNPNESKWWLGLGIMLEKESEFKEAKHAYLSALKPESLPFYIHNKTKIRAEKM